MGEHLKVRHLAGQEDHEFPGGYHDHRGRRLPVFRWVQRRRMTSCWFS